MDTHFISVSLGLITIFIITAIYWFCTRNFNHWTKLGIPGPRPFPVVGNLFWFLFESFPKLELEYSRKYGKIYGVFNGNLPVLTVNDPKLIKLILVKDFNNFSNRRKFNASHEILDHNVLWARDEDWRRLRSLSSCVFTGAKVKIVLPLLLKCVLNLIEVLKGLAKTGTDIDLKALCSNFSMDVMAKCAFATEINVYKDQNNPFVTNAKNIFHPKVYKIVLSLLSPEFLLRILRIKSMFDEKSNNFFFDIIRHLIAKRRKNNEIHNDLLQLLIDTYSENEECVDEKQTQNANNTKENSNTKQIKKYLTNNEIISQSWLFLLAGYETTSTALTFCFYELAINADIQERLFNELKEAMDSDNEFDVEILSRLPFLDSVISECLRLYPPFGRIEREVKSDYKLGDTGIILSAGQLVQISIYAVHHNEEFFPNPEQFTGDRFMPENRDKITAYSYLPFALGPRNCVGLRLAVMEMKLCVAQVVNTFRLSASHRTDIPPKYQTFTHLCVPKPLYVNIDLRETKDKFSC